ncbi:NHL repeat-containing protein 2-like [Centruroides sculpturatus]|uniref:NHL repeat-containing protein 2-like n=1 Tax=Centruroides sculpturatus TaxID=218467 RepID=UPI000C6D55CA|nr:NHL repeat-containing protein 2-like [Centruroides sculpturatus]
MADDSEVESFGLNKLLYYQSELEEALCDCNDVESKKESIFNYIEKITSDDSLKIPDFGLDHEWINTEKPLSVKEDLKGKIIVLDFFTYCCINCMHILPDLFALEEEISITSGLVVVGVHSAKFDNERYLKNVMEAIQRYQIHHPVVNDPQGILWNKLQIYCWPTLIIVGKKCKFLLEISESVDRYAVDLPGGSEEALMTQEGWKSLDVLRRVDDQQWLEQYPKLDQIINFIFEIKDIIGGLESGFIDGNFTESRFCSPQGIACKNSKLLYVADTENHAIRQIDLESRKVKTIAGTGKQGYDKIGGKIGIQQEISSPWDVCLASSIEKVDDLLFITMAGTHQIWVIFLEDAMLYGESFQKGTCVNFAGSGNEENRNNKYRMKAGFAQPSGIVRMQVEKKQFLYVADSESSSIRCVSVTDGSVTRFVGGDMDPVNLFAFGDKDGIGIDAKLQHPMGITYSDSEKLLYVADTYNNKIKVISSITKNCYTLKLSDTESDKSEKAEFYEPSGLCFVDDNKTLFVADTNNHSIKIIDLKKKVMSELNIKWNFKEYDTTDHLNVKLYDKIQKYRLPVNGCLKLTIEFNFKETFSLNKDVDQIWNIQISDDSLKVDGEDNGNIDSLFEPLTFILKPTKLSTNTNTVCVLIKLFLCHKEKNVCLAKIFKHKILVDICNETLSEKDAIVIAFSKLEI